MRILPLVGVFALFSGAAFATTTTINDPFNSSDSCNSGCDVIGDRSAFDIQKMTLTVTNSTVTADMYFNYGYGTTLSSFSDLGVTLSAADLFFTVNGTIDYGVALTNHGGTASDPNGNVSIKGSSLNAGDLYQVNNSNGLLDAEQVLNYSNDIYRNKTDVWLRDNGSGSITDVASGSVTTNYTSGNGLTTPNFDVTVSFTPSAAFLQAYNAGTLGVQFESATCGNDVLTGSIPAPTPEPMSMLLVGGGLCALGLVRKARRA